MNPKRPRKGRTDWKRVDALSEEEIGRAALSDPACPPSTREELKRMRRVPEVKRIRHVLGMTQAEFARRFQISLSTLRDWEQGRYPPDQSARTLLKVISKIPEEVQAALES
jgi:putative transcriptional regulator